MMEQLHYTRKEFDESYHSQKDGALRESLEKHIIPAFKFSKDRDEITILDIGFGLGYNTSLHIICSSRNSIKTFPTQFQQFILLPRKVLD